MRMARNMRPNRPPLLPWDPQGASGPLASHAMPDISAECPLIVGVSPTFREVMRLAELYAPETDPISLWGETGVGKGLLARWIHHRSARPGTFVHVRAGDLVENLYQARLFGSVRGAFTGADSDRPGAFELANNGTLFADDLERWCRGARDAMLAPVDEHTVLPVGAQRHLRVAVRLIVASHRSLDDLVLGGVIEEDFRFRFGDFGIYIPPLRERPADILSAAYAFLDQRRLSRPRMSPSGFDGPVHERLLSFSWPGNVRQVRNAVRIACAHAAGNEHIRLEHLPPYLRQPPVLTRRQVVEIRRYVVEWADAHTGGDRRAAAGLIGLHPNSIDNYRKRVARVAASQDLGRSAGIRPPDRLHIT